MDELLRIFLSWQFIFFCLGLAGIGFVFRRLVEYFILDNPKIPASRQSTIWRAFILPVTPVILGGLAGYFAKNYPYPEGLAESQYGRVSFGLVAGLLSGLVYRVIKELLRSKMSQGNVPTAVQPDIPDNIIQNIQITDHKDPVIIVPRDNRSEYIGE